MVYSFFLDLFTFLKNIYFLINVSFIIAYEFCKYYCLSGNIGTFIENLSEKLSKKNILYVKIFQACALNNNAIDDTLNNKLIKFTDNAPWNEDEDIDLITLQEFAEEYDIYIENHYKPINSGMISLVFKGIDTISEETVIIKMKRKNIEERLNDGIEKLLFFMKIVDMIPFLDIYGLPEVIRKNMDLIKHQTNFLEEVENIQHFKKKCQGLKYIVIPDVYEEVTLNYPDIILMEYIKGSPIYTVEKKDYEIFAKRVMQFFFISMFLNGIVHGDLHIGNILFITDDGEDEKNPNYRHKIGILDFGIVYDIRETKNILFDIFTELCSIPPRESAKKILLSGLLDPLPIIKTLPPAHFDKLLDIVEEFIRIMVKVDKKISQLNMYKFVSQLKDYIAENKIEGLDLKISSDLLKMQVMFGMLHGVILTLCNNEEYIDLGDRVIRETFHLELLEDDEEEDI
jgi:predicted unusual protein kinase regulating ubiquinone biosynthesis (AarF/ABC1/UbiB family)